MQFAGSVERSCQVEQNLGVIVLEEFAETIPVHLDRWKILFRLNIYVSDVEPDVCEVGRRFSDLSENVARILDVALVREDRPDSVRRPDIPGIHTERLCVHRKSTIIQFTFLFNVIRVVRNAKPNVPNSN